MIRIAQSLCAFVFAAAAAAAQDEPVRIDPGLTDSGAAYTRAVRWQRLQDRLDYFDPNAPAPPADARLRQRERQVQPDGGENVVRLEDERGIWIAIALAIVGGVAVLAFRFGNFSTLGFGAPDAAPGQSPGAVGDNAKDDPSPGSLSDILSIRDRAAAVHALLAATLARAAAEVDLYLHPSWTARDILRRIPPDWAGRAALGDLTRVAEEVHFGGRAISEDEFDRVVRGIAPVFRRRPA